MGSAQSGRRVPDGRGQVGQSDQVQLRHLELIAEQLPVLWWTTDSLLRFTTASGNRRSVPPISPQEVVGQTLQAIVQTHDERDPAIAAHRQALSGQTATYEYTWRSRAFYTCVATLHDVTGAIVGTIGVSMDITERTELELQLKKERDELAQSNQIMLGREERILDVKREVNALLKELGRPPRYTA